MVAILNLVGKGHESPEIVKQMLHIETFGNKPQYNLADEVFSAPSPTRPGPSSIDSESQ